MTADEPLVPDHETPVEKEVEEIAGELEIKLPKESSSIIIRIIVVIMIVGGLSILGSVFTDFITPKNGSVALNFYRFLTGAIFLCIAYGLHRRERWALWLYGVLVFIGLMVNFVFALIPLLLVVYLYTQRHRFRPCFLDVIADKFFLAVQAKYQMIFHKDRTKV